MGPDDHFVRAFFLFILPIKRGALPTFCRHMGQMCLPEYRFYIHLFKQLIVIRLHGEIDEDKENRLNPMTKQKARLVGPILKKIQNEKL